MTQPAQEREVASDEFRLLVESVKDYAIFMLDPGGHVMTWNAGAQRLKGYTAGYGQEEDRKRAMDAGFDHHLTKPVRIEKVLELLGRRCPG